MQKERNTALGGVVVVVIFFAKVSWKAQINFQHSNTGNLRHPIQEFQKGKEEIKK